MRSAAATRRCDRASSECRHWTTYPVERRDTMGALVTATTAVAAACEAQGEALSRASELIRDNPSVASAIRPLSCVKSRPISAVGTKNGFGTESASRQWRSISRSCSARYSADIGSKVRRPAPGRACPHLCDGFSGKESFPERHSATCSRLPDKPLTLDRVQIITALQEAQVLSLRLSGTRIMPPTAAGASSRKPAVTSRLTNTFKNGTSSLLTRS
jgi:hypothetical protein